MDINVKNHKNESPIFSSLQHPQMLVVTNFLIKQGAELNLISQSGFSLIQDFCLTYSTCYRYHDKKDCAKVLTTLKLLQKHGVDLQQKNKKGEDLVWLATPNDLLVEYLKTQGVVTQGPASA